MGLQGSSLRPAQPRKRVPLHSRLMRRSHCFAPLFGVSLPPRPTRAQHARRIRRPLTMGLNLFCAWEMSRLRRGWRAMQGQRIVQATMAALSSNYGLVAGSRLLFSGCSAGTGR